MANCSYVTSMLSEYIEGDLPVNLCGDIASHLSICAECRASAAELETSMRLCRQYRLESRPAPLPESAREELKAALEEALLRIRAGQSEAKQS